MKRMIASIILASMLLTGCSNSVFLKRSSAGSNDTTIDMDALVFGANYEGSVSDLLDEIGSINMARAARAEQGSSGTVKSALISLSTGGGSRVTSGEKAFFLGKVIDNGVLGYKTISHEDSNFTYFEVIDFIEEKNTFLYAYQTIVQENEGDEGKLESQFMAYDYTTGVYQIIFAQTSNPNENLSQSMFVQKLPNKSYLSTEVANATYSKYPADADYFLYFGGKAYYYTWQDNAAAQNIGYWQTKDKSAPASGAYVNKGEYDLSDGYMRVYNQVEEEKRVADNDPDFKLYSMVVYEVIAAGEDFKDVYMSMTIEYKPTDLNIYADEETAGLYGGNTGGTVESYDTEYKTNSLNLTIRFSISELKNTNIYSSRLTSEWVYVEPEYDVPGESGWAEIGKENDLASFTDNENRKGILYYYDKDNIGRYNVATVWDAVNDWIPLLKRNSLHNIEQDVNATVAKDAFSQMVNQISEMSTANNPKASAVAVKMVPNDLSTIYGYTMDMETGREIYYHIKGQVEGWQNGVVTESEVCVKEESKEITNEYIIEGYAVGASAEFSIIQEDEGEETEGETPEEETPEDTAQAELRSVTQQGDSEKAQRIQQDEDGNYVVTTGEESIYSTTGTNEPEYSIQSVFTPFDEMASNVSLGSENNCPIINLRDGETLASMVDQQVKFEIPSNFSSVGDVVLKEGEIVIGQPEGSEDLKYITTIEENFYRESTAIINPETYPIYENAGTPEEKVVGTLTTPTVYFEKIRKEVIEIRIKYEKKYASYKQIVDVENGTNYFYACEVVSPAGQLKRGGIGVTSVYKPVNGDLKTKNVLVVEGQNQAAKFDVQAYIMQGAYESRQDDADKYGTVKEEKKVFFGLIKVTQEEYHGKVEWDFSEVSLFGKTYSTITSPKNLIYPFARNSADKQDTSLAMLNGPNYVGEYTRGAIQGGVLEVAMLVGKEENAFIAFFTGNKDQRDVTMFFILTVPMPLITTQDQDLILENQEDEEEEDTGEGTPAQTNYVLEPEQIYGYVSDAPNQYAIYNDYQAQSSSEDLYDVDDGKSHAKIVAYADIYDYNNTQDGSGGVIDVFAEVKTNFRIYDMGLFTGLLHVWKYRREWEGLPFEAGLDSYGDIISTGEIEVKSEKEIDGMKYYVVKKNADINDVLEKLNKTVETLIARGISVYESMKQFINTDDRDFSDLYVASNLAQQSDGTFRAGALRVYSTNEDKSSKFGTFYTMSVVSVFNSCSCNSYRKSRDGNTWGFKKDIKLLEYYMEGGRTISTNQFMLIGITMGYSYSPELVQPTTTRTGTSYGKRSNVAHLYVDDTKPIPAEDRKVYSVNAGTVTDLSQTPLNGNSIYGRQYVYFSAFAENGIYFVPAEIEEINGRKDIIANTISLNDPDNGFSISKSELGALASGFKLDLTTKEEYQVPVDNTVATMMVNVPTPEPLQNSSSKYYYAYSTSTEAGIDDVTWADVGYTDTEISVEFTNVKKNGTYYIYRVLGNDVNKTVTASDGSSVIIVDVEFEESTFSYIKLQRFVDDWTEGTIEIDESTNEGYLYTYACTTMPDGADLRDNSWKMAGEDGKVKFKGLKVDTTYYVFERSQPEDSYTWSQPQFVKKEYVEGGGTPFEDKTSSHDYKDVSSYDSKMESAGYNTTKGSASASSVISYSMGADNIFYLNNKSFLITTPDVGVVMVSIDRPNLNATIKQEQVSIKRVAEGCYFASWKLTGSTGGDNLYLSIGFDDDGSSYLRGDLPYAGIYKIRLSEENSLERTVVRDTMQGIANKAVANEIKILSNAPENLSYYTDAIIGNVKLAYDSYVKIAAYNQIIKDFGYYTGEFADSIDISQEWSKAALSLASKAWSDSTTIASEVTVQISDISKTLKNTVDGHINDIMAVVKADGDSEAIKTAAIAAKTSMETELKQILISKTDELTNTLDTMEALRIISEEAAHVAQEAEMVAQAYVSAAQEASGESAVAYKNEASAQYDSFEKSLVSLINIGSAYFADPISRNGYSGAAQVITNYTLLKEYMSAQNLVYELAFVDALCEVYPTELKLTVGEQYSVNLDKLADTLRVYDQYYIKSEKSAIQVESLQSVLKYGSYQQGTIDEVTQELKAAEEQQNLIAEVLELYKKTLDLQLKEFSRDMIMENFSYYITNQTQ